ncbi:hypothetical protein GCM10009100_12830 [Thalassospira tepidiphila]
MKGDVATRRAPWRELSITVVYEPEHGALNLFHFAGGILLPSKETSVKRSGATVKDVDAAGRKDVPARRVCFWRRLAALHRLNDAPHRPAQCALPDGTPKTNKVEQI